MRRCAVLTFLSALLLFSVQPLMARTVLPWFGGGARLFRRRACSFIKPCSSQDMATRTLEGA